MHAQNDHYAMLIYCINGRKLHKLAKLCPIPFVNLTNTIIINYSIFTGSLNRLTISLIINRI